MKKYLLLLLLICSPLFSTETLLILIRHGETQWNLEEREQGQKDIPLDARGLCEAQAIAEKIRNLPLRISAIYSSPLQRAWQTASPTAEMLHLCIHASDALKERYCACAEGMTRQERQAALGQAKAYYDYHYPYWRDRWNYTSIPGAETMNIVLERARREILSIGKCHPQQTVAIFTHAGVIAALITDCTDRKSPYISNGSIAYFELTHEGQLKFLKLDPL